MRAIQRDDQLCPNEDPINELWGFGLYRVVTSYSARGLVAYTNQLSLVTWHAYDEAGRRTFETNANKMR